MLTDFFAVQILGNAFGMFAFRIFYKESDLWPPNGFKANGKPQRVEGRVVVGGDRVWYTEHYQTFTEIID